MAKMQTREATSSPMFAFQFAIADLAISQTATAVPIPGGVIPTYIMPKKGWIVGYAINKSADHTAGSLDFDLTVAGTSTLTIAADTTDVYATLSAGNEPFAAGDAIGVTYTSDASLDPTTVDVVVTVFVMLEGFSV